MQVCKDLSLPSDKLSHSIGFPGICGGDSAVPIAATSPEKKRFLLWHYLTEVKSLNRHENRVLSAIICDQPSTIESLNHQEYSRPKKKIFWRDKLYNPTFSISVTVLLLLLKWRKEPTRNNLLLKDILDWIWMLKRSPFLTTEGKANCTKHWWMQQPQ